MSSVEKREPFAAGTLVGERYRIVSLLARGGFGAVYVAEQLATARQVALKLLTLHASDVSVDRLLAEARIASRVNSEHIVQVFDAGIDPESSLVFVVMELLSGMDLAELVQKHGPRGALETAEYLRQVALGLDKVHGVLANDGSPAPIVHRDLKPANLFLTQREDGTAWIKILDFGAAKMLLDDVQSSGVVRGTPDYMAYEQAAGGTVTRATDIWAFGLVAFTLLTGRSYWRGSGAEAGRARVFAEILSLPLARASERAQELDAPVALDDAFDAWFFRCVNRDPAARFASAGEAARELSRALDVSMRPVQAPSLAEAKSGRDATSTSSLHTKDLHGVATSSRRNRAPFSAGALIALLVAIGAVAAVVGWSRTRRADTVTSAAARASGVDVALPAATPRTSANEVRAASAASPSEVPPAVSAAPLPSATLVLPLHAAAKSSPPAQQPSASAAGAKKSDDPYDLR